MRWPDSSFSAAMLPALAVELDLGDLALDADRAVAFGHGPQELRVERRIQLVGVVHPVVGKMRELARVGRRSSRQ